MPDMGDCGAGDIFGICRRNGFAHFRERHPVDPQCLGCGCSVPTLPDIPCSTASSASCTLSCMSSIDADHRAAVMSALWLWNVEISLKQPMALGTAALSAQAEHRSAQGYWRPHGPSRSLNVLNDPQHAIWHPVAH